VNNVLKNGIKFKASDFLSYLPDLSGGGLVGTPTIATEFVRGVPEDRGRAHHHLAVTVEVWYLFVEFGDKRKKEEFDERILNMMDVLIEKRELDGLSRDAWPEEVGFFETPYQDRTVGVGRIRHVVSIERNISPAVPRD